MVFSERTNKLSFITETSKSSLYLRYGIKRSKT